MELGEQSLATEFTSLARRNNFGGDNHVALLVGLATVAQLTNRLPNWSIE
jgi:hypothetical protein